MKKTSFEHYCLIITNIYQKNGKMVSGFPTTSGQYPQLPALQIGQIQTLIRCISGAGWGRQGSEGYVCVVEGCGVGVGGVMS